MFGFWTKCVLQTHDNKGTSRHFLDQETLRSLLSTSWFEERSVSRS